MLRSKMAMICLAAAALGFGTAWTLLSVFPPKIVASVMIPTAAEAPAPAVAPVESAQNLIRIDGERSELRLGGKDAGQDADKDGVSLRTSVGKLDLRW